VVDIALVGDRMTLDTMIITPEEDNKAEEGTIGRIEIEDSSMMVPEETIGLLVETP
jgi:hypothetical protein